MNKTEFRQKILQTEKPIVVDFWAPWCAPCKTTKPILDNLAREYADRVELMPVNADDSHEVLQQHRVFGIPTVVAIRDGKEIGRMTGARSEADYRSLFDALAQGGEFKVALAPFDRILRIGAGTLFIMIGVSTGNWLVTGAGGILAFMGVYDRCPIWNALTGMFQRR